MKGDIELDVIIAEMGEIEDNRHFNAIKGVDRIYLKIPYMLEDCNYCKVILCTSYQVKTSTNFYSDVDDIFMDALFVDNDCIKKKKSLKVGEKYYLTSAQRETLMSAIDMMML